MGDSGGRAKELATVLPFFWLRPSLSVDMLTKSAMGGTSLRTILACALLLTWAIPIRSDVVFLTDGRHFAGEVVANDSDNVIIRCAVNGILGELQFQKRDVESVVIEEGDQCPSLRPSENPPPQIEEETPPAAPAPALECPPNPRTLYLVGGGIYVDPNGPTTLRVQGQQMGEFACGLARVRHGGRIHFVATDGQIALAPAIDDALDFAGGLCAIRVSGKWGFMDRAGNIVVRPRFDEVRSFSEGLAAVRSKDKWGYINHTGKRVIPLSYDNALSFREGMAGVFVTSRSVRGTGASRRVSYESGWGFIDSTGRTVVKPVYSGVRSYREGMAAVARASATYYQILNSYGLTDTTTDHRAGGGDAWGYINKSGNEVIACKFWAASDFREGLAAARTATIIGLNVKASPWGYIDRAGEFAIRPQFDSGASEFSEGLAAVAVSREEEVVWTNGERGRFSFTYWGYIDRTATLVIPYGYSHAEGFRAGHALVVKHKEREGEVRMLLNKNGAPIWTKELK